MELFVNMAHAYAILSDENKFVAERVAAWLQAHDQYDRWPDSAECATECLTFFTGVDTGVWLTDDQSKYLALVHLEAASGQTIIREPGEAEKLAYRIAQVIIHARTQFRAYLPHIIKR